MLRTRSLIAPGAAIALAAGMLLTAGLTAAPPEPPLSLVPLGTYRTGIFDASAAEIVAHDPDSQRLFVVNFAQGQIDILSVADPTKPTPVRSVALGGTPNSVDVHDGLVAVAVEPASKIDPGHVVFLDIDGNVLKQVMVGALPDMLTFTPDGRKHHSVPGRGIDPSDHDPQGHPTFNIRTYRNLYGIHMPDGMASMNVGGITYLLTANEGDAREYTGLTDVSRARDLRDVIFERTGTRPAREEALCADAFPDRATLILESELGRLNVSTIDGYDDERGCFFELHALGGRSFSIFTTDGVQVFDSGEDFERITQARYPTFFNSTHTENNLEGRSDDKGPEPEGITVAELFGRTYAMLGLERIGGVITYDVTNPLSPIFVNYTNNRDFTEEPFLEAGDGAVVTNPLVGDLGTEGLIVIQPADSPTGRALVVTANEVSGTTTVFEVVRGRPVPPVCASFGPGRGGGPFWPPPVCSGPFPPAGR